MEATTHYPRTKVHIPDRYLTSSEPRPLSRHVSYQLACCLDTAMSCADAELEGRVKNMDWYHLSSIVFFYRDGEKDECCHAGYSATYLSYNAGKPTVHQYGWDMLVAWNGKDSMLADMLRQQHGLCRYSLFTRKDYRWQFNHAGQLPMYRRKEEELD